MKSILTVLCFVFFLGSTNFLYSQKKLKFDANHASQLDKIENFYNNSLYDSSILAANQLRTFKTITLETSLLASEWIVRNQIKIGNYAQAAQNCDSLISILNNSPDHVYTQLLVDKSEILLQKGYGEKALEVITQAENINQTNLKENTPLSVAIYAQKGIIYWSLGNIETALGYSYKALQIQKSMHTNLSLYEAKILNNIGLILLSEQPDDAQLNFLHSKGLYESLKLSNSLEYANLLNNIAIVHKIQKKYFLALDVMNTVLAIRKKIYTSNHPNIAFVHATKASLYYEAKLYKFATDEILDALNIYKSVYGIKHPEIASAYDLLGQIALQKKEHNQAIAYYQKALVANSFNFMDSTNIYNNAPVNDAILPELMCVTLLLKSHALEDKYTYKTLKLREIKMAVKALQSADTLIWKLKNTKTNKNDKIRLSNWSSDIYESLIKHQLTLSNYTKNAKKHNSLAFVYAERNKASVLAAAILEVQSKHFSGIPDSIVIKEHILKKEIAYCEKNIALTSDKVEMQSLKMQLFENNKKHAKLIELLEKQYPKYYELKYKRNDSFTEKDLQKTLSNLDVVITYTVDETNGMLYTFVVTNKTLKIYNEALSRSMDNNISALRNGIIYHAKETFEKASYELYETLLKNKIPKGTQNIYWIPDGRLGTIPLEVLLMQKNKEQTSYKQSQYLVTKYNVSHHYSAAMLANIDKNDNYQTDICLAAPVDFIEKFTISNLPASLEEVTQIAKRFEVDGKSTKVFTNSMATETLLKSDAFDNSKYIHLATHGLVDELKPELSKIILTESQNSTEDGILYAGEIYNLKLNSELVTLSACQTGLGKITKGEGMIGLSRSLLYAGAKNILTSLWSVSDQSTFLLMNNFYTDLLAKPNGTTFSSSLRLSKLKLIQTDNYSNPYYWAAFTLLGR